MLPLPTGRRVGRAAAGAEAADGSEPGRRAWVAGQIPRGVQHAADECQLGAAQARETRRSCVSVPHKWPSCVLPNRAPDMGLAAHAGRRAASAFLHARQRSLAACAADKLNACRRERGHGRFTKMPAASSPPDAIWSARQEDSPCPEVRPARPALRLGGLLKMVRFSSGVLDDFRKALHCPSTASLYRFLES